MIIENGNSNLYDYVLKYTTINIAGFTSTDYTYNLTKDPTKPLQFILSIAYRAIITGKPSLYILFNFPVNFLKNYERSFVIVKDSSPLDDYCELSAADLQMIANSKAIAAATKATVTAGLVVSLAAFPSFGPLKIMMVSSVLTHLRYLDINYPRIMRELFDIDSSGMPLLLINYNNPDDFMVAVDEESADSTDNQYSTDLFAKYDIPLYFVSNFGDQVIQVILIIVFSHLLLFLQKKVEKPFLVKILNILISIYVWGWLLAFYISNVPDIVFYIVRSWCFSKRQTDLGKEDLAVTIIIFIIIVIIFCYIFYMNMQIYFEAVKRKKEKEEEEEEEKKKAIDKIFATDLCSPKTAAFRGRLEFSDSPENKKFKNHDQIIEFPEGDNKVNLAVVNKSDEILQSEDNNSPKHGGEQTKPEGEEIVEEETLLEKRYAVCVSDCKHDSFMTIILCFAEMLKFIIYSIILVVFYQRPLMQITLLLFTNFYFLVYLFIFRPHESSFQLWMVFSQEMVLVYGYVIVAYLAYLDLICNFDTELRNNLGRLFGYTNWALLGVYLIGYLKDSMESFMEKAESFMGKVKTIKKKIVEIKKRKKTQKEAQDAIKEEKEAQKEEKMA